MSERLAPARGREEFGNAVRRAAWARCGGRCEGCGRPLVKGGYTYDHTTPWRRGGASTLDNCKVLCRGPRDSCDARKTFDEDLPGIAAAKRYGKNRLPLDIDRPPKQPPKMRARKGGFPKGRQFPTSNRPLRGRDFQRRTDR